MGRPNGAKVAMIDGHDRCGLEPFCKSDHRRIHGAKWKARVLQHERGHSLEIVARRRSHVEQGTSGNELGLCLMPHISSEQVGNLTDAQRGDDQIEVGPGENLKRLRVETIAAVGDGEKRATVDDAEQAYFSQPSRIAAAQDFASSSSMSAEVYGSSLSAMPIRARNGDVLRCSASCFSISSAAVALNDLPSRRAARSTARRVSSGIVIVTRAMRAY